MDIDIAGKGSNELLPNINTFLTKFAELASNTISMMGLATHPEVMKVVRAAGDFVKAADTIKREEAKRISNPELVHLKGENALNREKLEAEELLLRMKIAKKRSADFDKKPVQGFHHGPKDATKEMKKGVHKVATAVAVPPAKPAHPLESNPGPLKQPIKGLETIVLTIGDKKPEVKVEEPPAPQVQANP